MDKEFKKEWIIKRMNEIENEEIIDFFYGFTKGYIDNKERKIKENNMKQYGKAKDIIKHEEECLIQLLEIQNKFK